MDKKNPEEFLDEILKTIEQIVIKKGALELIKVKVAVTPLTTTTNVSLNKGGLDYLRDAFGIKEEEIESLTKKYLEEPLEKLNEAISDLKESSEMNFNDFLEWANKNEEEIKEETEEVQKED